MGRGRGGDDEKEPAHPKPAPKGDQITNVIGEIGRWQLEKILIVFIAAAPGNRGRVIMISKYIKHFVS